MNKPLPYNVPVDASRGAPHGRPSVGAATPHYIRLRARRVLLSFGYDKGGAYWGNRRPGEMLFCVCSPDRSVVRWVDARTHLQAEEAVRREFPDADFLP